jgi:vesicle-fusing ATPase
MLEIDNDFAKKVAVPGVSNLRELGTVLQEMENEFSSNDINSVINEIGQQTGSDNVGVGIKTVLDCVFEAKRDPEGQVTEAFTELLVGKINELRA